MSLQSLVKPDSNLFRLLAFLELADFVLVDDGPYLDSWETAVPNGLPDNEMFRFSWCSNGCYYSVELDEAGIEAGKFAEEGVFRCLDCDGEKTEIRFFSMTRIYELPAS